MAYIQTVTEKSVNIVGEGLAELRTLADIMGKLPNRCDNNRGG